MPGFVIYNGPSLLDGAPIVVIAVESSRNRKTGNMVQTFILRADMDPIAASRTGADLSICGTCPHRGAADPDKGSGWAVGRTCYVNLVQAPLSVFNSWKRGIYPVAAGHAAISEIGWGRMVRIGTYGDGAAVPPYIWDSLCSKAKGWTAYTHQSNWAGAAADPARFMVSVENTADAETAWEAGARTFRVVASPAQLVSAKEILCPASKEAGARVTRASFAPARASRESPSPLLTMGPAMRSATPRPLKPRPHASRAAPTGPFCYTSEPHKR